MDVEIFALCDAAADYGGGRLSMLGVLDRIHAKQFPATHPHCAVALRIRFEHIEEGSHRVRINFIDEDGKSIIPGLEGNINVKFPPDVPSVCANMVLNLNGIRFDKPGRYSIDLAIDGRMEKSRLLNVVQMQDKPQPGE